MSKMDEIVVEWLDIAVDSTKDAYHSNVEPFEVYKERVKLKGLRAFNDYLNSIEHGYELIIQRLESELKPSGGLYVNKL